MIYFVIGILLVPANLLIVGYWLPRPTPLSNFLASYNFIIWSALVAAVWSTVAVIKTIKNERLSWMAVTSTIVANVISISLGLALSDGDKITTAMFGLLLFLLPSVLATLMALGLSVLLRNILARFRSKS